MCAGRASAGKKGEMCVDGTYRDELPVLNVVLLWGGLCRSVAVAAIAKERKKGEERQGESKKEIRKITKREG